MRTQTGRVAKNISISILSTLLTASAFAWQLSQPAPLDAKLVNGKPAEAPLQSPYVGRYQFKDYNDLFPQQPHEPNETASQAAQWKTDEAQRVAHGEYYTQRMFSTELQLPGAPLGRYYVPDLQYDVIPSDKDGNPLPTQPGLRLIPVSTQAQFNYRVPLIHVGNSPTQLEDIHEHYPAIFAKACHDYPASPTARVYDEEFVTSLLDQVKTYQQDPLHHDTLSSDLVSDASIAAVMDQNKEATIGTDHVEDYAHKIAYGTPDTPATKQDPLHIITPHTSAEQWFFNSITNLIAPSSKPQTSISHVTGFYRFAGASKNSRRSMLSEGEPTNLRMVFTKNLAPDQASAEAAIAASQLNLSLWFTLYYENPEGYYFAENYDFDDAYMTNLEEVMEMARGWLDHKYIRQDFNKDHAPRIQKQFDALMVPIDQISKLNAKASTPTSILDVANQNLYQIRNLVTLLYGDKAGTDLDAAQSDIYNIQNKIQNPAQVPGHPAATPPANIQQARKLLTADEIAKVNAFTALLKKYQNGALAAAAQLPYYTLLQKEAALAEYCNEGVKDQTDKSINIPLTLSGLSVIYGAAEAQTMLNTAERNLCTIQITRENLNQIASTGNDQQDKQEQDILDAKLASDPCALAQSLVDGAAKNQDGTAFSFTKLSSPETQNILSKMVPVYTLPGMVQNPAQFTANNPLLPKRKVDGSVDGGFAENAQRDHDIRLIGNSLAYGPQTTLDIIVNLTKAYLPFYKAGAGNAAIVAAAFLPEHNLRTGISTDTYIQYAGKILAAIYGGEGEIYRSKLSAGAWNQYTTTVATFFKQNIPAVIKNALANQRVQEGQENLKAVKLSDAQIATYAQDLYAAVKEALDAAIADPAVVAALPLYEFNIYQNIIGTPADGGLSKVDAIVAEANKISTSPPNAIKALYDGTKRVKFYYQPGLNSLDHMGLVKRNPNVSIVDIGTAVEENQTVEMDSTVAGQKQFVDQQIDNGVFHQEIVNFTRTAPSSDALNKFQAGLFNNSIVGRAWDAGAN